MNYSLRGLLLFTLLLSSIPVTNAAAAVELNIDIGKNVFGLPAAAKEADIRALLGEPAAVIAMKQQRHGLLYGTNLMLIFDRDQLWQARTWFVQPWSPQLYHGWLQYVPPTMLKSGGAVAGFTVNQQFRLGGQRAAMEKALGKAFQDADEFSAVARFGDAELWFGYAYPDEGDARRDVSTQTIVSLVVEFRKAS